MVLLFGVCVAKEAAPNWTRPPQILYPIKISKLAGRERELKDDAYSYKSYSLQNCHGICKLQKALLYTWFAHAYNLHRINFLSNLI